MSTVFGAPLIILPGYPPAPASIEYRGTSIVGSTKGPFNAIQQRFNWRQGVWAWSVSYPPIRERHWPDWEGFLFACNGISGVFQIGDPRRQSPRGSVAGSPVVFGENQTGYNLVTSAWTPNANGVLLRGDYIQIGYRLHVVTAAVNAGSDGTATIPIWPPIRETPNGGGGSPPVYDPVITSNTKGLWRMSSNSASFIQRPDRFFMLTFEIEDAI